MYVCYEEWSVCKRFYPQKLSVFALPVIMFSEDRDWKIDISTKQFGVQM